MIDRKARAMALVALVIAAGSYALGSASADPTTEPDAAALAVRVDQLEAAADTRKINVAELYEKVDAVNALVDSLEAENASLRVDVTAVADDVVETAKRTSDLEDDDVTACLAYSDFHYYKERIGKHGKKWRLPVMVWRADLPACRPTAKAWTPGKRVRMASR